MNSRRGGGSASTMRGRAGWAVHLRIALALSDAFVVTLVMVIAQYTPWGIDPDQAVAGANSLPYATLSVAIGILWWVLLGVFKSRETRILGHGPQEFQRVARASLDAFIIVGLIGFLTQWQISRAYLLVSLPVGMVAIMIYRLVWRTWVHAERSRGRLLTQVLVIGPAALAADVTERLGRDQLAGYKVAATARIAGTADADRPGDGMWVIEQDTDIVELARKAGAEVIVVAGSDARSNEYARRLGWQLEGTDIGLIVAPALAEVAGPRVLMTPVQGLPLMHVDAPEFTGAKYWTKAIMDKLGAGLILAVLGIPMLIVAAIIKITSPGPVFFTQERIGLSGEPFKMLKFRSMVVDAEARLKETMGGEVGVFYKRKDDPRITPVGRFIRRFSIDELPQLLNVIKGDMSLVGPRPQVQAEVDLYTDVHARRLLVKPGLTGLWQVSGRSDLSEAESIRLDAYYVENWSLSGDILILLRTFTAVVGSSGAY